MTWYSFLLFAHVSMAVIWIGGGLMMQFFGIRAAMSGDPTRMAVAGSKARGGKKRGGRVDHLAAARMLQEYLESRGESEAPR